MDIVGDAMSQELIESIEDGVATLTLNRPEARNALTREMMTGLADALPRLAADPAVRVVVVTGAGRAFCSGGDVKGFARRAAGDGADQPSFDQKVTDLRMRMEAVRWLHEMPKPTLAVIPGPAAGAGLSIALACDLRIAADDARLTTAFAKVGLSGDFGGSYFLSTLVGASRARELYFTARLVGAEEALRGARPRGGRVCSRTRGVTHGGGGLHEAQPERRAAWFARRHARRRGDPHGPHVRNP
jgi:2-(1,2-epoxy-1,2-dihydrophenyl)acetyl-CoA isomerase